MKQISAAFLICVLCLSGGCLSGQVHETRWDTPEAVLACFDQAVQDRNEAQMVACITPAQRGRYHEYARTTGAYLRKLDELVAAIEEHIGPAQAAEFRQVVASQEPSPLRRFRQGETYRWDDLHVVHIEYIALIRDEEDTTQAKAEEIGGSYYLVSGGLCNDPSNDAAACAMQREFTAVVGRNIHRVRSGEITAENFHETLGEPIFPPIEGTPTLGEDPWDHISYDELLAATRTVAAEGWSPLEAEARMGLSPDLNTARNEWERRAWIGADIEWYNFTIERCDGTVAAEQLQDPAVDVAYWTLATEEDIVRVVGIAWGPGDAISVFEGRKFIPPPRPI